MGALALAAAALDTPPGSGAARLLRERPGRRPLATRRLAEYLDFTGAKEEPRAAVSVVGSVGLVGLGLVEPGTGLDFASLLPCDFSREAAVWSQADGFLGTCSAPRGHAYLPLERGIVLLGTKTLGMTLFQPLQDEQHETV